MTSRREVLKRSASVAGMLATLGLLPAHALAQARLEQDGVRNEVDGRSDEGARQRAAGRKQGRAAASARHRGERRAGADRCVDAPARRQALLFLVEKNPNLLSAMFDFSDGVEPNVAIRLKMEQSSKVYAVMMLADGRVLYAQKDVSVTLGGCG